MKVGDRFQIKTTTIEDKFGTCIYEVLETGVENPNNPDDKTWVMVKMLSGTGPHAREGLIIYDDPVVIAGLIKSGKGKMLSSSGTPTTLAPPPPTKKQTMEKALNQKHGGTGCVEL